jgi:hypothetical protein
LDLDRGLHVHDPKFAAAGLDLGKDGTVKPVKIIWMATIATAVLALIAASASATTLTSPKGTIYTGTIKATSSDVEFHGSFTSVTCSHSAFEGKVEKHGAGVTAGGKVSGYSYSSCGVEKTVKKAGSLEIHSNGVVTSSGLELVSHLSIGECVFTTSGTTVGTITSSETSNAVLDLNSARIPRTGGSFFCGSSATLTGQYTITTPSTLLVD